MNNAKKITFLGLGAMGSALAQSFVDKGFDVTVWNRTKERAHGVVSKGAKLAGSASEAVDTNELIVACLANNPITIEVLSQSDLSSLKGKTLISCATSSISEAIELSNFCKDHEITFIDVKLLFYPHQAGSKEGLIYVATEENLLEKFSEELSALGGQKLYLGPDFKTASALYIAVWTFYYSALYGFMESAAFVERCGLSISLFADQAKRNTDGILWHIDDITARLATQNLGGEQADLRNYVDGLGLMSSAFDYTGVPSKMFGAILALTKDAVAAGHGRQDVASVVKYLNTNHAVHMKIEEIYIHIPK